MDPSLSSAATSSLRPWSTLISPATISLPLSLAEISHRLSVNINFFHINYINISLTILFLSLLFHPFAVILFLLTASAWYYFLIKREYENEIMVFDFIIRDRTIFVVLGVVTVLSLVLANVWMNVFVSVVVSGFVVFVLAVIRDPSYEEGDYESPYGALLEMAVPEVNKMLLGELEEMGFPLTHAIRALYSSGNSSLDATVNWLFEHGNDADICQLPSVIVNINIESLDMFQVTEEVKLKALELSFPGKEHKQGKNMAIRNRQKR